MSVMLFYVKVFFLPMSNTIITCFKDDSIFAWESETLACKYQLHSPDPAEKSAGFRAFACSRWPSIQIYMEIQLKTDETGDKKRWTRLCLDMYCFLFYNLVLSSFSYFVLLCLLSSFVLSWPILSPIFCFFLTSYCFVLLLYCHSSFVLYFSFLFWLFPSYNLALSCFVVNLRCVVLSHVVFLLLIIV